MSNVTKIVMYTIVALVIVAALTHPAGAAGLMTGGTTFATAESSILSGQNNAGGVSGTVTGNGNLYSF